MKNLPIDRSEARRSSLAILQLEVPRENIDKALRILKPLGFMTASSNESDRESISWREAFSNVDEKALPGICLRGAREKEGITQSSLSKKTGIPQRHISEMENGKRPIGKKNARLFANALNVGYKIFL